MCFKKIGMLTFFVVSLIGQTTISGNVSGIWDSQSSPYQLSGNTAVPQGDTLFIEANTSVDFGVSNELRIRGVLIAHGATFINGGSLFGESGTIELDSCQLRGLDQGIGIYGGFARIHHCLIESTLETGITFSSSDSSFVRQSQILNSGGYGIKITQSDLVEVYDNLIQGNSQDDFNHPALFIDSCSPQVIERNIVQENHAQGIGVWTLTAVAAPIIKNNLVRRNFTGITIVNSPPLIKDNIIVANYQEDNFNSGAGIFAGYPSSQGIVMGNYIGGNYYGVSNINNAALNLGDMVNDYPGDDGLNIFYDNTYDGATWNIWNDTSHELLAQNNFWQGLPLSEVDATLHDNEEGAGEIIYEPIYAPAIPTPPDVNNDGEINVLDVIVVIENILDMDIPEPLIFYLSDINTDYYINVNDALALIDLVVD